MGKFIKSGLILLLFTVGLFYMNSKIGFDEKISGNIVDIENKKIYSGTIFIKKNRITKIVKDNKEYNNYILPGLIDSHIHIESSMLSPSNFARGAVVHGTVATVSDPHEISNVLGIKGVEWMIKDGKKTPFKFYFGASPCVPATEFETSGATLSSKDIETILKRPEIKFMAEMMNYPGVISGNKEVLEKIDVAKKYNKPIDGHIPYITGKNLEKYVKTGISTDHEATNIKEAKEKINLGMKIIIREGSAAKNFDALKPLIQTNPDMVMLCSDDRHPDDLKKGHINSLVKRALNEGYDKFNVLQAATLNPVKHYNLDVGLLKENDFADFIIIDNFKDFNILKTYINGKLVADSGKSLIKSSKPRVLNNFSTSLKNLDYIKVKAKENTKKINVINAIEGELITTRSLETPLVKNGYIVSDPSRDILKILVVNRYSNAPAAIGFIKNFGLKKGAMATSVAHDSHNIVALGVEDKDILQALNLVIKNKGGMAIAYDNKSEFLPLPIAGLMSDKKIEEVAQTYSKINNIAQKELGCRLKAPYMTMSFMALLVIPEIKLGDKGLFDAKNFEFINLQE